MRKYEEAYHAVQDALVKDPSQSVSALCKKLGINPTIYYYGKRAIAEGKAVKAAPTTQAATKAKPKKETVAAGVAAAPTGKRFLLIAVSEEQLRKLLP